MRLKKAKRIYTTKLLTLIDRGRRRTDYPYEFINKMSEEEINIFFSEVREQLKTEGIRINKNIKYYNSVFRSFLDERESIYQLFKETGGIGFK